MSLVGIYPGGASEMLEQSVKPSRLIIFYVISNSLIYAPILRNREPKTGAFRSVFVFRAVVSVAKTNVLQMPTIAVFARNSQLANKGSDLYRTDKSTKLCMVVA